MNKNLHPVTEVLDNLITYFIKREFQLRLFTEIRTVEEEFDSVQIYKENPVRDFGRTFYVDDNHVLQAHTSALRETMVKCGKGKYLIPGRIYRVNREDPTHNYIAHQLEGCMVQSEFNMLDFHSMMKEIFAYLGLSVEQFSYTTDFTIFTSPTYQYYYRCHVCGGMGCDVCDKTGIIAYAAGGIQKNTFVDREANISFCISVDRLAMLTYQILDARRLYQE